MVRTLPRTPSTYLPTHESRLVLTPAWYVHLPAPRRLRLRCLHRDRRRDVHRRRHVGPRPHGPNQLERRRSRVRGPCEIFACALPSPGPQLKARVARQGFEGCCDGHSELEVHLPCDASASPWRYVIAGISDCLQCGTILGAECSHPPDEGR